MKYTNRILLIILTIVLATSCSDDATGPSDASLPYFTINDGNVWYYDLFTKGDQGDYVYGTRDEYTLSPSLIGGEECLKYYLVDEGEQIEDNSFKYARTDENGYYIYYDEFIDDYSDYADELKDVWVKFIDFKNENWTQFDVYLDFYSNSAARHRASIKFKGEIVGKEEVEYKGKKYNAFKSLVTLTVKDTTSGSGLVFLDSDVRSVEFTIINEIGIYKIRQASDGEFRDSYQVLTDHK